MTMIQINGPDLFNRYSFYVYEIFININRSKIRYTILCLLISLLFLELPFIFFLEKILKIISIHYFECLFGHNIFSLKTYVFLDLKY